MKDLIDWVTAIATIVLIYAALRYPLYPPGQVKGSRGSNGELGGCDCGTERRD